MLKTNCVHFQLDRPCAFHKLKGIKCNNCNNFEKSSNTIDGKKKILIIKLGAIGDVLRTTFLLEGLKEKYKKSHITWIAEENSTPLLQNNSYINRVVAFNKNTIPFLAKEIFDTVINLDLSPQSLCLATAALSKNKIGFWLSTDRKIICSNSFAKKWLLMSAFDDVKKSNKKTYQWWVSKIVGLKRSNYEIIVPLEKEAIQKAKELSHRYKLVGKKVVGINPGAGERWKLKKWTTSGYINLINALYKNGLKILLLGGESETALIKYISYKVKNMAINTGTHHTIPDFIALVNLCDLVVCGDTLAMHIALGLKKKVVALFGPTSASEIEMYNRGIKIVTPIRCQCCYKTECDIKPNCMQMIKPEVVFEAVEKMLRE